MFLARPLMPAPTASRSNASCSAGAILIRPKTMMTCPLWGLLITAETAPVLESSAIEPELALGSSRDPIQNILFAARRPRAAHIVSLGLIDFRRSRNLPRQRLRDRGPGFGCG